MAKLFKDLKTGLEDVVAYKKGKLTLRSELIELPEPTAKYRVERLETQKIITLRQARRRRPRAMADTAG